MPTESNAGGSEPQTDRSDAVALRGGAVVEPSVTWQARSLAVRDRRINELLDGLVRLRQILRFQDQLPPGSPVDELIRRLLREDAHGAKEREER